MKRSPKPPREGAESGGLPARGEPGAGHRGITRRQCLKAVGAAGCAAALVGKAGSAAAYRKVEGWPDRFGMLVDLTECVGCRSCEAACNAANSLPAPEVPFDEKSVFEERRRPTPSAYTVVNRYEVAEARGKPVYRKVQCNHCNEPGCASACPVRAYRKTPEGAVLYDPDVCFGCRYCMVACPFNAPAYDYDSALEPRVVKCTLCHGRVKQGGVPACSQACPVEAIRFGKREELIRYARLRIAKYPDRYVDRVFGEEEVGGTGVLYLSAVPFGKLDFPEGLPETPLVEQTKGFLSAVPLVLTLWPIFLGMAYAATKNKEEKKP